MEEYRNNLSQLPAGRVTERGHTPVVISTVAIMLLSPGAQMSPCSTGVEGSPQVLRLSQHAEDALLLTSPAGPGRSPLSPSCGRVTREAAPSDAAFTLPMAKARQSVPPATVGLTLQSGRKDEDRALVEGDGRVLAVFDGHLGDAMSQFAADNFLAALRNAALEVGVEWRDDSGWARVGSEASARNVLCSAFRGCHEAARQRGKRGGSTALVFWSCLVEGRKLGFCANAGDSRAVIR